MNTSPEQLLSALLPGESPYLIRQSDDPPASTIMLNSWAATGRTYDVVLQFWLADRGEWFGRNPAIWINDVAIEKLAAEQATKALPADLLRSQITSAVVCHEAAHVAEAGIDRSQVTPELTRYAGAVVAFNIAVEDGAKPFPPMFGHSLQFVRLAIHTAYRAAQAGFPFPVDYLFNGENYQIAQPNNFEYALGNEPECLASVSLFAIREYRPPTNFLRLWNRCVHYWIDQQPPDAPGIGVAAQLLDCERQSMSAVLDQLLESKAEQKRKAQHAFYDIARRIAAGDDDPTLSEVKAALAASGKTDDDLIDAVNVHRRRNENRDIVRHYNEADDEKRTIEQQITAADAELTAAQDQHRRLVWPLQAKLREINELATKALQAKRELQSTCPCEETTERLASVQFEQRQVGREIEQKSKLVERQKAAIAENNRNGHDVSVMEGRMAEANAELAGLRVRLEQLLTDERGILEEMIER